MLKVLVSLSLLVIIGLGSTDAILASRISHSSSTNEDQNLGSHVVVYTQSPSVSSDSINTEPTSSSGTGTDPSTSTNNNSGTSSSSPVEDATTNWAGYVSTGGTYTSISGTWTIPSVTTDDNSLAADASWIGIGGVTSDDLIQVGTQNMVEDGQVTTGTFYEELPNTSTDISTVNVSAGDSVTASLSEVANGEWSISMKDNTNGESYSTVVYYNSSESSAEWIEEAPSDQDGIMPLDAFGSVAFTGGSTDENGNTVSIAGSNAQVIVMENEEGQALATTSAITNGGNFTVTRTDATANEASSNTGSGDLPRRWSRSGYGLGG